MEKENIDYVVCKICGHKSTILSAHLKRKHNLSRTEYEEKYNSPVICETLRLKKRQSAIEWNKRMYADPEKAAELKRIHQECAKLPQVRKAQSEYMKNYLATEAGKNANRKNMQLAIESCGGMDKMQSKATEAKRNSEKFRITHVEAIRKVHEMLHGGSEWGDNVQQKAMKGCLKEYIDCNGNIARLRSSYELTLYNYMITHGIDIHYEEVKIVYNDSSGKRRRYWPDFYIPDKNLLLEVKPKMFVNNTSVQVQKFAAEQCGYNYLFVTEKELNDLNSFFHNVVSKIGS